MMGGSIPFFHDKDHTKSAMDLGKGTEIYAGMHFDPSRDHVVFKNSYSAFLSRPPALREKIDALKRGQLIFAGIAANVCVESTVRDAMQLDYEVVVVSDGTTTIDDAMLEGTLKNTHLFFGDHMVYLQAKIRLDFLEDGTFNGKEYKKGDRLDFACADFYELDEQGKIRSGCVYIKFFNV